MFDINSKSYAENGEGGIRKKYLKDTSIEPRIYSIPGKFSGSVRRFRIGLNVMAGSNHWLNMEWVVSQKGDSHYAHHGDTKGYTKLNNHGQLKQTGWLVVRFPNLSMLDLWKLPYYIIFWSSHYSIIQARQEGFHNVCGRCYATQVPRPTGSPHNEVMGFQKSNDVVFGPPLNSEP